MTHLGQTCSRPSFTKTCRFRSAPGASPDQTRASKLYQGKGTSIKLLNRLNPQSTNKKLLSFDQTKPVSIEPFCSFRPEPNLLKKVVGFMFRPQKIRDFDKRFVPPRLGHDECVLGYKCVGKKRDANFGVTSGAICGSIALLLISVASINLIQTTKHKFQQDVKNMVYMQEEIQAVSY